MNNLKINNQSLAPLDNLQKSEHSIGKIISESWSLVNGAKGSFFVGLLFCIILFVFIYIANAYLTPRMFAYKLGIHQNHLTYILFFIFKILLYLMFEIVLTGFVFLAIRRINQSPESIIPSFFSFNLYFKKFFLIAFIRLLILTLTAMAFETLSSIFTDWFDDILYALYYKSSIPFLYTILIITTLLKTFIIMLFLSLTILSYWITIFYPDTSAIKSIIISIKACFKNIKLISFFILTNMTLIFIFLLPNFLFVTEARYDTAILYLLFIFPVLMFLFALWYIPFLFLSITKIFEAIFTIKNKT